jgi:hypothetical protein
MEKNEMTIADVAASASSAGASSAGALAVGALAAAPVQAPVQVPVQAPIDWDLYKDPYEPVPYVAPANPHDTSIIDDYPEVTLYSLVLT